MDDLERIRGKLKDRNLRAVAKNTGLSYRTVWSISNGKNATPAYNTVRILKDYLIERKENES